MTYGEFLQEVKTDNFAKCLLSLWYNQRVALYPAIEQYIEYKKNKKGQLKFLWEDQSTVVDVTNLKDLREEDSKSLRAIIVGVEDQQF